MIIGLIITGVFVTLIIYLGFRDLHYSKLPNNESPYLKYSSPELYIISILGIVIGVFISFGLIFTLVVGLIFLTICYFFLKNFSPYFDFFPPRM